MLRFYWSELFTLKNVSFPLVGFGFGFTGLPAGGGGAEAGGLQARGHRPF